MVDFWRRVEEAAKAIRECMDPSEGDTDPHGVYTMLKRWYLHVSARALNPSQTNMEKARGKLIYPILYGGTTPLWPTPGDTRGHGPSEQFDLIGGGGGESGPLPALT